MRPPMRPAQAFKDMAPPAKRLADRCADVEELIRRIRHGDKNLDDLLTQLNIEAIRVARLALLVRDGK